MYLGVIGLGLGLAVGLGGLGVGLIGSGLGGRGLKVGLNVGLGVGGGGRGLRPSGSDEGHFTVEGFLPIPTEVSMKMGSRPPTVLVSIKSDH